MKFQNDEWSCGPAAIVNALRCHSVRVSERTVRAYTGTTEDGTDENDIKDGLVGLGFSPSEFETTKRKDGVLWLSGSLSQGPVIACVDSWQHWVCIVGKVGNKFIIIDSVNTNKNVAENGVQVIGSKDLLKRWKHKTEGAIYGILVTKKK